tara:strand:- start:69 stop:407 length:339 start_codon:yes stop_codon:yes gene_type:complete
MINSDGLRDNKKQKFTFNSSYVFLSIFLITFSITYISAIAVKNSIGRQNDKILESQSKIEIIKNSIAVESKNNSSLKRKHIKVKARELGMKQTSHRNIIDSWWDKEKFTNAK